MVQKGVNMFDIRVVNTQIVFDSVLDHFIQYGQFLALPEGHDGCFRLNTPLSLGATDKGRNGPKVGKYAWYHCFMSRKGVW